MVCPRRRPPSSDEHEAQRVRADSGFNQAISLGVVVGVAAVVLARAEAGRARAGVLRRRARRRRGRAVRGRAPAQHAGCTWDARAREGAASPTSGPGGTALSRRSCGGGPEGRIAPASPGGKSYVPVVRVPCGPRARVAAWRVAARSHNCGPKELWLWSQSCGPTKLWGRGTILLTYCALRAALDKA